MEEDALMAALVQGLEDVSRVLLAECIPFALCGGLAVAVHGYPRFTEDIDLIVDEERLDAAKAALARIGFAGSGVVLPLRLLGLDIHRLVRIEGGEHVILDLMPLPGDNPLWADVESTKWKEMTFSVLGVKGLIKMKAPSERSKDKVDIAELERLRDNEPS